jgi:hypothetical protein
MLDVKQKLKLLAIEEEIARLELELYREGGAYLGTKKSEEEVADDQSKFEQFVLNPVLQEMSSNGQTLKATLEPPDNIKLLYGQTKKGPPQAKNKKKKEGVFDSVSKAISNVAKSGSRIIHSLKGGLTPHVAWKIQYNKGRMVVLLGYAADQELKFCTMAEQELLYTPKTELEWESLWIKPGTEETSFGNAKDTFKTQFQNAAQALPSNGSAQSPNTTGIGPSPPGK